jgi:hypothetical protein
VLVLARWARLTVVIKPSELKETTIAQTATLLIVHSQQMWIRLTFQSFLIARTVDFLQVKTKTIRQS